MKQEQTQIKRDNRILSENILSCVLLLIVGLIAMGAFSIVVLILFAVCKILFTG